MNSSNLQPIKTTATTSESGNTTGSVSEVNVGLREIKLTVYLSILLFSVTGNTLVILSVVFFQRLKTVPNTFIANLAACDLVTTVSSIPFDLASEELGYWPYGGLMCKVLWPLATFSTTSAVLTLISISSDRYGALIHPLDYRYKITKRKCFVMIFVGHAVSALAILPYLAFLKYVHVESGPHLVPQCQEEWPDVKYRKAYTVFLFCLQYGIPLPIMVFIYIRLGMVLYESTHKVTDKLSGEKTAQSSVRKRSKLSTSSFTPTQALIKRRKQQNEKTVKMFFFVVLIFLVFMVPNQILWLWYDFGPDSQALAVHVQNLVMFICRAFTYTNSVLNALVYGVCNSSFRNAFRAILRGQCGKRYQRDLKRSLTITQRNKSVLRSRASRLEKKCSSSYIKGKGTQSVASHKKSESSETAERTSNSFDEIVFLHYENTRSTEAAEVHPISSKWDSYYGNTDEGMSEAKQPLSRVCSDVEGTSDGASHKETAI